MCGLDCVCSCACANVVVCVCVLKCTYACVSYVKQGVRFHVRGCFKMSLYLRLGCKSDVVLISHARVCM